MRKILSFGAGINSTAILALIKLGKYPPPDRIIFCDTGAERPETYCYMKYISNIFNIETVKSNLGTLVEYCRKYKILPSRQLRWCSDKFKVSPFIEATPEEHIKILGISYDESQRVKDLNAEYPLIDMSITRDECIRLILKAGLEIPVKSGCFICPFMKIKELKMLKEKHSEHFNILSELEREANERNNKIFFRGYKLVENYVSDEYQDELDGFENYQHCLCKFD